MWQRNLRSLYGKTWLMRTMLNMRSIEHVSCDFCLVIAIMFLFFAAMNILVMKGKIEPYWMTWATDRDTFVWD